MCPGGGIEFFNWGCVRGIAYVMEIGLKVVGYLEFCGEGFLCGGISEGCNGSEVGGVFVVIK